MRRVSCRAARSAYPPFGLRIQDFLKRSVRNFTLKLSLLYLLYRLEGRGSGARGYAAAGSLSRASGVLCDPAVLVPHPEGDSIVCFTSSRLQCKDLARAARREPAKRPLGQRQVWSRVEEFVEEAGPDSLVWLRTQLDRELGNLCGRNLSIHLSGPRSSRSCPPQDP